MTGPLDPGAPITYGRDFNFFQNVTVTASISAFNTDADVIITFPTYTVTFMVASGASVQYSFNGNTIHGDLNGSGPNNILTFQNRVISKIWFRGTGPVRVEAWGIR
jgi:hypothetical protein